MSGDDATFNDLRKKLDVMGYHQTLPTLGISLVAALFGDLIKTTESLRDSKKEIMTLLEEKMCWEQGVDPYKCDNARLIAECNELHMCLIKQREEADTNIREYQKKLRALEAAKAECEERCQELQKTLNVFTNRHLTLTGKRLQAKPKQPFISTVRSGDQLPPLHDSESLNKCKCKMAGDAGLSATELAERERLQRHINETTEELEFYKRKVDTRNREICRLNQLLAGGRPLAALVKDCCYKELHALKQDIEILQHEKIEYLTKLREMQNESAEYREQKLNLESELKHTQFELNELKEAALQVETQANEELYKRDEEIRKLKIKLDGLNKQKSKKSERSSAGTCEQHNLIESLNKLKQSETDLKLENDKLCKKLHKMHTKHNELKKIARDQEQQKSSTTDEEKKIRLKAERDFFEKEYLRLVNKRSTESEIEFLQSQLKSKDQELAIYRGQITQFPASNSNERPTSTAVSAVSTAASTTTNTARTTTTTITSVSEQSDCVKALIMRVERERDCARNELESVRCERDSLREKHLLLSQMHAEELKAVRERSEKLYERVMHLERENRDLTTARIPTDTHIALLKEEIAHLKQRIETLQTENTKLTQQNQSQRALQEDTLRLLHNCEYKLTITERQLQAADCRLNANDTNKETANNQASKLRSEINALKQSYATLKNEKESINFQLEVKTDTVKQLENELKDSKIKQQELEKEIEIIDEQLKAYTKRTQEREAKLTETAKECKSLREEIAALKASRDNSIKENGGLSNDLAECHAELHVMKRKLRETEQEVERMKQQLHQYVQEIKKTEDLLLEKEREREKLLEHYRSLSQDAIALEGSNQTLETETTACKHQIAELEHDVTSLKQELHAKDMRIVELENKHAVNTKEKAQLQTQLNDAHEHLRKLRADLAAHKELCEKLDNERAKLKAEIAELNAVRIKLESDMERLRAELKQAESDKHIYTDTMNGLLTETRTDLIGQMRVDSKLTQELSRLRQQNEEILQQLQASNKQRELEKHRKEQLIAENNELRHNLTDNLYQQALSNEHGSHVQSATL